MDDESIESASQNKKKGKKRKANDEQPEKEKNFLPAECRTIVDLMVEKHNILENADSTAQQKNEVYKYIFRRVNA